ncbi:hypothetical protein KAR91_01665 [Candidatus Pacearchaeota archaeon]|nr:hypothetical protein [Candidatus Pacearchaeota archaeon]
MAEFAEGRLNGDYGAKMMALAEKLEAQQIEQLHASNVACDANIEDARTWIKIGKKYDKIDVGGSGKLMIVRATGEVFGIKAYGVIHKGHAYGTLDTIDEWYWGLYYPVKLKVR